MEEWVSLTRGSCRDGRSLRLHHLPALRLRVDQHCHTMLVCNLRQQQLQQGEHLKKKCKLWAPTWQKQVGWAYETG